MSNPMDRRTVLVVAPHPDDEVLGCGGAIARHTAAGDQVYVLVVSRGAIDIYGEDSEDEVRQEAKTAHGLLGVKQTFFLDFPAPKLDSVPGYQMAGAIAQVIQAVQPEIVYLPHRGDIHADHRVVHLATLVAARPINQCSVQKLLCYETLSETEWSQPMADAAFIPNVFVDISDYLDLKRQAMACYQSELQVAPHPRSLAALTALAQFRGSTISRAAAEAFMLMREII
jgi:N-acetylglucosamine malate deacetylase 1